MVFESWRREGDVQVWEKESGLRMPGADEAVTWDANEVKRREAEVRSKESREANM